MDIVDRLNTAVARGSSHLDLSGLGVDDQQLKVLVERPNISKITELILSDNQIRPAAAYAIARSKYLANLRCLDLRNNRVLTEGARALAESLHLSSLVTLDLGNNFIQDDGVVSIAASPNFKSLQVLGLSQNGLSAAAARALADSHYIGGLVELNLRENDIGPDGARCLASSVNFAALRILLLSSNGIGDAGCRSLAESQSFVSLSRLDLSYNNIAQEGAKAIADSSSLRSVSRLCLLGNAIGNEGLEMLSRCPSHFPSLETLNIEYNNVTVFPERLFELPALTTVRSHGNDIPNLPAGYHDDTVDNVKRYLSERRLVDASIRIPDVFISYGGCDSEFARGLAERIEGHGLKVWFAEWDLDYGVDIVEGIQNALNAAKIFLVILSPEALRRPWVRKEISSSLHQAITEGNKRVVPVMFKMSIVPAFLRGLKWVDFTKPDAREATTAALINSLQGKRKSRSAR